MNVLGVSCYYHDAAACLIRDGHVVAAAQEERFNRRKFSAQLPVCAINYCVQAGGIAFNDIDYVGFYEKPFLKFSRVLINHLKAYPFSLSNFLKTTPEWLKDRLVLPLVLKKELGIKKEVFFIKHHLSHAASAFLVSPFEKAAILTADGVGEWATLSCGLGEGNNIKIFKELHYPDSLGLLYTAITTYLGFKALAGEGKVMGLAAYGKPVYLDKFRKIVAVNPDGSFQIDECYFGFNRGGRMYSDRFVKMFGPAREPEGKIDERHSDMAASIQAFTEEVLISIARNLNAQLGVKNLCLAGGLFLNCVANHKILENTGFEKIFVQPAAGDSGGALGVAAYIYNTFLNNPRNFVMKHAYLGPEFSQGHIKRILRISDLNFKEFNEQELYAYVAGRIAKNKIVGWFQGRMEFGPRALGNRSILANPCNPEMKELLNSKVKKREQFRPYAPAVLAERSREFFALKDDSPFMLLACAVREDKKNLIPAVTHVDTTARVQTVAQGSNPRFWQLIKAFEKITGVPILINTSFNLRGEPIVCSPEEAIECFKNSEMDILVLENFVLEK